MSSGFHDQLVRGSMSGQGSKHTWLGWVCGGAFPNPFLKISLIRRKSMASPHPSQPSMSQSMVQLQSPFRLKFHYAASAPGASGGGGGGVLEEKKKMKNSAHVPDGADGADDADLSLPQRRRTLAPPGDDYDDDVPAPSSSSHPSLNRTIQKASTPQSQHSQTHLGGKKKNQDAFEWVTAASSQNNNQHATKKVPDIPASSHAAGVPPAIVRAIKMAAATTNASKETTTSNGAVVDASALGGELALELFLRMQSYRDVTFATGQMAKDMAQKAEFVAAAHVVTHVFRQCAVVAANNKALKAAQLRRRNVITERRAAAAAAKSAAEAEAEAKANATQGAAEGRRTLLATYDDNDDENNANRDARREENEKHLSEEQEQELLEVPVAPRDQGFHRAKVLILCPTRAHAYRLLRTIVMLTPSAHAADFQKHVGAIVAGDGWQRFEQEYGGDADDDGGGGGGEDGGGNKRQGVGRRRNALSGAFAGCSTQDEYAAQFLDESPNTDDHFRIGLAMQRSRWRFFSDFSAADVIVASPLGLVTLHTDEVSRTMEGGSRKRRRRGDAANGATKSASDELPPPTLTDVLSSIEVLLVHAHDAMVMQNHAHVDTVGSLLNMLPGEGEACLKVSGAHSGIDFSRVREYFLSSGGGKSRRQTVVITKHDSELLRRWARTHCSNEWGTVSLQVKIATNGSAALARLPADHPKSPTHRFRRFDASSPSDAPAARLAAFESLVAPFLSMGRLGRKARDEAGFAAAAPRTQRLSAGGVVVFVPDYLDYCDFRAFMRKLSEAEESAVAYMSEYSSKAQSLAARRAFEDGTAKVLLCTERAHYFRRAILHGARHIVFCQLPLDATFYAELSAYTSLSSEGGDRGTVETLFCSWDRMRLERVVGWARARKMMCGDKTDFTM